MSRQRKVVLVVEDHPSLRGAIRDLLHRMGLDTLEAGDGTSAMSRLACCTPDLVCLDLVLPESSGYEVCEFIRRSPQHRRTPVLIMSERAYPEDRAHAAEVGANAFIVKPFSEADLRRRIESLLALTDGNGLAAVAKP
jgi:DNA-binding response OmpR family regulator